jgi:hypothetical protein
LLGEENSGPDPPLLVVSWLRGVENVQKRYLLTAAARNLGLVMRHLFGIGTPRSLQGLAARLRALAETLTTLVFAVVRHTAQRPSRSGVAPAAPCPRSVSVIAEIGTSSTGC